jgi:hypothetical protein
MGNQLSILMMSFRWQPPSPWSVAGRVLALVAERHSRTPRPVAVNSVARDASVFAIPRAGGPEHACENSGIA